MKKLVAQVLHHISWLQYWNMSSLQFMEFIGISETSDPVSEESSTNRSRIQQAVTLLLALFRRIENKMHLICEVMPFLQAVGHIACNLNDVWDPELRCRCNSALVHKIYSAASDLDKLHLLEYMQPVRDKSKAETQIDSRIQNFLWSLSEGIFSVLGSASACLPNTGIYKESAFFLKPLGKCHFLPRMMLKLIVKHFLKPFAKNSTLEPGIQEQIIDRLSSSFLPWLFTHIDERWHVVESQRQQPVQKAENELLEQEVIEDQANRLLSREFADLLNSIFLKSSNVIMDSGTKCEEEEMDVDMACPSLSDSEVSMSDACKYLMDKNVTCLVTIVSGTLLWNDSGVNQKMLLLNRLLLKEIAVKGMLSHSDNVSFIAHHIYSSLKLFSDSEQHQSSLLQILLVVYEELVKNFDDEMRLPFWQLSGCDKNEWQTFDRTLIQASLSGKAAVSDKRKKDGLRSLLSAFIRVIIMHLL